MKLLFIILAHNQPEQVLELATTLVAAASDGRVVIHFDVSAEHDDYLLLRKSLEGNERITLTERRVHCIWGDYSLVEATLVALAEARAKGHVYDYALLLSGACLPCRPIKQLERFLDENNGQEFIEANGPEWIVDGIKAERCTRYTLFPPLRHPRLERFLFGAQRLLGIKRALPAGITDARFGSQWWCLTWRTCLKILDFMSQHPDVARFYRRTWIPDEMIFNTLVSHFVASGKIARHNLTHYQFTDRGKPVVFYDDHGDYPFRLGKFFYRKVSSEAKRLRRHSLKLACKPDDGIQFRNIDRPNLDYGVKVYKQTLHPVPGQIFYDDQLGHDHAPILKRITKPYIVVCGSFKLLASWNIGAVVVAKEGISPDAPLRPMKRPYMVLCESPEAARATIAAMDPSLFEFLGRPCKAGAIDFGHGRKSFHEFNASDAGIRDISPALYLARIIKRSEKTPVFLWMPGDDAALMNAIIADPQVCLKEIRQWA